jgi:hypothetical protein
MGFVLVQGSEANFCEPKYATINMPSFKTHRQWHTLVHKSLVHFRGPIEFALSSL